MKLIGSIETEQFSLTIYECGCGFHIGIDNTYMDQVEGVIIECPSCTNDIDTDDIDEIDEMYMEESTGC